MGKSSLFLLLICLIQFSLSIHIQCQLESEHWGSYSIGYINECEVMSDLTVTQRNIEVTNIEWNGNFEPESSSIQGINIYRKDIYYLPKGIDKFLEHLVGLSVSECKLVEISQDDLKVFTKLKHLWLGDNQIEVLGEDLCKFNPDLIYINIRNNKIKEVHPTAFDGLKSLNYFYLNNNACVNEQAINNDEVASTILRLRNLCKFPETTTTTAMLEAIQTDDIENEIQTGIFTKFGIVFGVFGVILIAGLGLIYFKRQSKY